MSLMPSPSAWNGSNIDRSTSARVTVLEGKNVRTTRFFTISSGTSGAVTLPPNATVVLDDFGGTVDAVVATVSGGRPTYTAAIDSGSAVIAATFDSGGNYVLSATPSAYPVALVYRVQQSMIDFDSTSSDIVGPPQLINVHSSTGFKAGVITNSSFSGTPLKYAVVFGTPYASNAYSIAITGMDGRDFIVESRTTTGFTINTGASTALTGDVTWSTIISGEQ